MSKTRTQTTQLLVGDIPVKLVRSRRSSFAIQLDAGEFTLRAPKTAADHHIGEALDQFKAWVRRKHAEQLLAAPVPQYTYTFGESFPLLGGELLLVEQSHKGKPQQRNGSLAIHVPDRVVGPQAYIKRQLTEWYKEHALAYFKKRVAFYSPLVGAKPEDVRIYTYKRRWGSCSSKAVITFNWQIILASPAIADYVVVHELAHLVHFNHSPAYWQLVETVMPDYKVHRQWLRKNGHTLTL